MRTGCGPLRDRSPFSRAIISLFLVAVLSLVSHIEGPAVANAQGTQNPAQALAGAYVEQGFQAVGPWVVAKVTTNMLVIQATRKATQNVDLTGKNVTVLDAQGKTLALGALRAGTTITFLSRGDDFVIIVMPKEDRSDA
jgi:hypothetical protein